MAERQPLTDKQVIGIMETFFEPVVLVPETVVALGELRDYCTQIGLLLTFRQGTGLDSYHLSFRSALLPESIQIDLNFAKFKKSEEAGEFFLSFTHAEDYQKPLLLRFNADVFQILRDIVSKEMNTTLRDHAFELCFPGRPRDDLVTEGWQERCFPKRLQDSDPLGLKDLPTTAPESKFSRESVDLDCWLGESERDLATVKVILGKMAKIVNLLCDSTAESEAAMLRQAHLLNQKVTFVQKEK